METVTNKVHSGKAQLQRKSPQGIRRLLLVLLMGSSVGCGQEASPSSEAAFSVQENGLMSTNGLGTNGLGTNGLGTNGLGTNGLGTNGLSAFYFESWFEQDPALHDTIMKYVVQCAVPAGQSRSYTSITTGLTYTWNGWLGLAPDWSSGSPATLAEQQVITACLAAHVNKYGHTVPISVLGQSATGTPIHYDKQEVSTFSEREACFFGNLFVVGGAIYAANDRGKLSSKESTKRACGLSSKAGSTECLPIQHLSSCKEFCKLDERHFYMQCTYEGVTYQPLTTRLQPSDIYQCGDDVCQFTESCGTGSTYDNCGTDCGPC